MRGRELPPSSPFAGDDGSPDPGLAAVLARYGAGEVPLTDVVVALAPTRVLVPVLAELEAAGVVEHDGHAHTVDKEASAGIVALRTPDGRTALPVFSGVDAMTRWRPDARPVPTAVPRAALSAVAEGWEVLVLDPAGPVTVALPRTAVYALAQGRDWQPAVRDGRVDEDVRAAVGAALADIRLVVEADAVPGTRAEVAVRLALPAGLDRAGLDGVLAQVNDALAHDPVIAARVDSLELRVRPA
ncbi:MAG: SseB family protein [Cellulomonas sp.]|uniref:SseB family protein n=1 Tax=Cellulomonas sp. TaxID=40001 RepID=UPI0019FC54F4|nr:SseB family protein [Cellulomonas sp.]MBF0689603.1 SseB family protein [Cellulomonas sp.]